MKTITLALTMLFALGAHASISNPSHTYNELVDRSGNISFPADYQKELVHVGTTAVIAPDSKKVQNLNGIYTQKVAVNYYNEKGEWPDGTVFVKDVKLALSEHLTTGLVFHQRGNDVFFVMVRDNKDRFTGNPNWGDGWGWAMYGAEPTVNESPNKEFCQGCHNPRKDNHYLYTDQYPSIVKEFQ